MSIIYAGTGPTGPPAAAIKGYTVGVTTIPSASGEEISRIRKAMTRWQDMDAAGKLLGRGLGRKEIIGRVVLETGATLSTVLSALKRG